MEASTYTLTPETEPLIEVDLETRGITVPPELKNIAVTGDNNAETIYLKVNNSFDGNSLSNKQYSVWFTNAGNETYFSKVTEVKSDGDFLILGWKIDNRLTRYKGIVKFQLQFEGELYTLNSLPGELNVLQGLDFGTTIPDPEEGVYSQLIRRMSDLERSYTDLMSQFGDLSSSLNELSELKVKISDLSDTLSFVKNKVVYLPD